MIGLVRLQTSRTARPRSWIGVCRAAPAAAGPNGELKLIDQLVAGYKKPEDIIGENGLLKQLTKSLLERAPRACRR